MTKSPSLKLSENGRLADGSLRFVVRLPKDLSDLFEIEMKLEDRRKLPLARYLLGLILRERQAWREASARDTAPTKSSSVERRTVPRHRMAS